jgi:hypothetical protein
MKRFHCLLAVLAVFLQSQSISFVSLHAQTLPDPAVPTTPETPIYTDAELDTLLGPIALYPDPLLAILLPAATHPDEIVLAARFLNNGGDPNTIDDQTWSDSVKALAHYSEVLAWMDESLDWTTALGNAFLNQPEAVLDNIQRLRALAQSLGNLQTTAQQIIENDDGAIDILPAYPDEVFVPTYDPATVYARPPIPTAGPYTRFTSHPIGAWLNRDWDWPNKRIVLWNKTRPALSPGGPNQGEIASNPPTTSNNGARPRASANHPPNSGPPVANNFIPRTTLPPLLTTPLLVLQRRPPQPTARADKSKRDDPKIAQCFNTGTQEQKATSPEGNNACWE